MIGQFVVLQINYNVIKLLADVNKLCHVKYVIKMTSQKIFYFQALPP